MGLGWVENGLSAIYFALIARFLGAALYGEWAYGTASCLLVIGLVGFGFDALLLLRLGRGKEGAAEFIGLMLSLRFGLLGLGAAGLAAYALAAEPDPLARLVLLLLVPALIGRGVALWVRFCFAGYERMADYARFAAQFRAAEAGLGVVYLAAGGGLVGIVVLHSLCWIGEAGSGLWRIHSRLTRYALRFSWRPAGQLLAEGAVLGVAGAGFTWLVAGPVMLLRHTDLGMAQVGQFAIVLSLTFVIVGSAHAFFVAALPVLSRSAPRADTAMLYGRLTALATSVGAVTAAGIGSALGPRAAEWALGGDYAVAGGLLGPFLLIGGTVVMPTGYEQALFLAGRRWPLALAYLAGSLCLAAGLAPAAAAWGLDGAVLATGGAWLIRGAVLIGIGEWVYWRRQPAVAPI